MAVGSDDLREYLRLPADEITVEGKATLDNTAWKAAVKKSGTYEFNKVNEEWLLNGATVDLSEYGIVPENTGTKIIVEYETENVDLYLKAAISKARAAGVEASDNAQYDLFILALAGLYYDNRGMTFDDPRNEQAVRNMINSFVLELRYAKSDAYD